MMHMNASSQINKTIMHQVFVLHVRTNSTDIVVKAIEHQKYVILLQVQVYICYQNRIRKKNIWHSTIFRALIKPHRDIK